MLCLQFYWVFKVEHTYNSFVCVLSRVVRIMVSISKLMQI